MFLGLAMVTSHHLIRPLPCHGTLCPLPALPKAGGMPHSLCINALSVRRLLRTKTTIVVYTWNLFFSSNSYFSLTMLEALEKPTNVYV